MYDLLQQCRVYDFCMYIPDQSCSIILKIYTSASGTLSKKLPVNMKTMKKMKCQQSIRCVLVGTLKEKERKERKMKMMMKKKKGLSLASLELDSIVQRWLGPPRCLLCSVNHCWLIIEYALCIGQFTQH